MIKLSIVLPSYNEGENLPQLIEGYRLALSGFSNVELILVNNGSTDDTAERLKIELAKPSQLSFKIANVPVNKGYGNGIMAGIAMSGGEYLAWSHADLQCLPQDVVNLYNAVMRRPNPRICFGKGYRINKTERTGTLTKLQTFLYRIILGYNLTEINAQPKLFHRDFISEFHAPPLGYELDSYAYYKAVRKNMEIVTVDVYFYKRKAGKSKWAYSLHSRLYFMACNFIYLLKLRFMGDKI